MFRWNLNYADLLAARQSLRRGAKASSLTKLAAALGGSQQVGLLEREGAENTDYHGGLKTIAAQSSARVGAIGMIKIRARG